MLHVLSILYSYFGIAKDVLSSHIICLPERSLHTLIFAASKSQIPGILTIIVCIIFLLKYCIFIDGLHHYKQVLKDIDNSLNCLNSNGVILMHDCLPQSLNAQFVPRTESTWNGDVWKALASKRVLKNLDCYTICADQGIGAILKRTNSNLLNLKVNNFKKLNYNYYYINHKQLMNIIEFEDFIKII